MAQQEQLPRTPSQSLAISPAVKDFIAGMSQLHHRLGSGAYVELANTYNRLVAVVGRAPRERRAMYV